MRTPLRSLLPAGQDLVQDFVRALCPAGSRRGAALLLSAGLLSAGAGTTLAQAPVLYGLGTLTQDVTPVGGSLLTRGTQGLVRLNPATGEAISPSGGVIRVFIGINPFNLQPVYREAPLPLAISGVAPGQRLVGSDYRPNTGQYFALGYNRSLASSIANNAQLYVLNTSTGVATPTGAALRLELGDTDVIGFDFNPTVDRIRVTSGLTQANYRLNPTTGTVVDGSALLPNTQPDGPLAYRAGDAFAGKKPGVGAVAYENSYIGSTSTTLYDFDEANTGNNDSGILSVQSPPNAGTLNSRGRVTFRVVGGSSPGDYTVGSPKGIDFDIYFNKATGQNEAYLLELTEADGQGRSSSNFYTFDLATRLATQRVSASGETTVPKQVPFELHDIAAQIDPPTMPDLQGQLLYAIAAGNLISFDSQNPGLIRSAVNFGAGLAAGQAVVGLDFRPATGQLYALGYDTLRSGDPDNARLYTVELATGALTAVGPGPIGLALGGSARNIGFDFNPTVDRIRVISTTNANYRLNPATGTLTNNDAALNGAPGPFSATAYTNNQSAANSTIQYVFSSVTGALNQVTNSNGGVISTAATSVTGTSTSSGGDFDIFNTPGSTTNAGFIATAASAASSRDNLYRIEGLGQPSPTVVNVGLIGSGSNITGLAAFIEAGTLLTWDGSASSDWATAANWTPAQVPTASNDVLIPGAPANQPVVSGTQQARVVTLDSDARLTLAASSVLNVGGNFNNNGGSVSGTGTAVLTGTAAQVVGGTSATTFPNLTVGPAGASTAAAVGIAGGLVLNGNLLLGPVGVGPATQPLTLLSSGGQSAYVVNNGSAEVSGAVTVQRSIDGSVNPQGIGYRHFASPVRATAVSDLNTSTGSGFTAVLNQDYNAAPVPRAVKPFPNVFGYDQDLVAGSNASKTGFAFNFDKGYFVPADAFAAGTKQAGLQPGRGYTVNIADDVTVDFVGTLTNGTVTVAGLNRSSADQAGYQFLGNPYPSGLDWNLVGREQLEPALYVYKSTGQYTGFYTSYNNGLGTNTGSNVLPVAQGFFVRAVPGASNGRVSFTNAARLGTAPAPTFQRGSADTRPQLTLSLRTADGRGEQTVIYFEAGATPAYEAAFDAYHLSGPGAPLSFASADGLSINGQPALDGAEIQVALALAPATTGTYHLQVDALKNLPARYHVYLRDAVTGTYTDLTQQASLPLLLTAGSPAAGRYAVVFSTQAQVLAAAPAALAQLAGVYPNPARGTASLVLPASLRGGAATPVQVLNSLGQVVLTRTLAAGATTTLELPLTNLTPGIYTVRANTAVGQIVKRLTVE